MFRNSEEHARASDHGASYTRNFRKTSGDYDRVALWPIKQKRDSQGPRTEPGIMATLRG